MTVKRVVTLKVPEDVLEAIDAAAGARGLTRTAFMVSSVMWAIRSELPAAVPSLPSLRPPEPATADRREVTPNFKGGKR